MAGGGGAVVVVAVVVLVLMLKEVVVGVVVEEVALSCRFSGNELFSLHCNHRTALSVVNLGDESSGVFRHLPGKKNYFTYLWEKKKTIAKAVCHFSG